MIEIREALSRKEQRKFLNFPLRLYKGNPYFVPPLYLDEKKIFRSDYVYYDQSEAVYYNAYRDGKMVGRISGILQKAANQKYNEKRVRFVRFDSIDDSEVARALFAAVEKWALSKGMDTVVGPLGFSDLEREGMLIEGFDQLSTFEEQYNAPYYPKLMDAAGYGKEIDWVESRISAPAVYDGKFDRVSEAVMKKYGLHYGKAGTVNEFIQKYGDKFFDLVDRSYDKIYGTVPFTDNMKKMMYDNFRLIMKLDYVAVVENEAGDLVALGICFPAIGSALQRSRGHLTPMTLLRILRTVRSPRVLDLGLIGVAPNYLNSGVNACICSKLMHMLQRKKIRYAETNLNLENNYAIQNMWKRFDAVQHKHRRCYVKKLTP